MTKTTEERVYEFIKAAVDAVTVTTPTPDDPLFDLEVHDHMHRKIKTDAGIRVGTASGELSPFEAETGWGEYNVELPLVIYCRIADTQKDDDNRTVAMRRAGVIAKAIAALFWDNASCDAAFRDTRIRNFVRGFDSLTKSDHFAVVNLTLYVNEVGGSTGR